MQGACAPKGEYNERQGVDFDDIPKAQRRYSSFLDATAVECIRVLERADCERGSQASSRRVSQGIRRGDQGGRTDSIDGSEWAEVRSFLEDLSRQRALVGFGSDDTAAFVFSLKRPLFEALRGQEALDDPQQLADDVWTVTLLLDALGLHTVKAYQRAREDVINRQQQELLELSTPVVKLWDGILALPMIGTLDSRPHPDRDGIAAAENRRYRVGIAISTSPACPPSIRWWRSTC